MIQIFDVKLMKPNTYEERDKNVFYNTKEFKTRIIELKPNEEIPTCEMSSYVIFYVIQGSAQAKVNQEIVSIEEGQCLITEPATLSLKTNQGVKIMGIQIVKS